MEYSEVVPLFNVTFDGVVHSSLTFFDEYDSSSLGTFDTLHEHTCNILESELETEFNPISYTSNGINGRICDAVDMDYVINILLRDVTCADIKLDGDTIYINKKCEVYGDNYVIDDDCELIYIDGCNVKFKLHPILPERDTLGRYIDKIYAELYTKYVFESMYDMISDNPKNNFDIFTVRLPYYDKQQLLIPYDHTS
ncbi:MAG: hypothetical protein ACRDD8_11330 [Bacteroidales bacterium]